MDIVGVVPADEIWDTRTIRTLGGMEEEGLEFTLNVTSLDGSVCGIVSTEADTDPVEPAEFFLCGDFLLSVTTLLLPCLDILANSESVTLNRASNDRVLFPGSSVSSPSEEGAVAVVFGASDVTVSVPTSSSSCRPCFCSDLRPDFTDAWDEELDDRVETRAGNPSITFSPGLASGLE